MNKAEILAKARERTTGRTTVIHIDELDMDVMIRALTADEQKRCEVIALAGVSAAGGEESARKGEASSVQVDIAVQARAQFDSQVLYVAYAMSVAPEKYNETEIRQFPREAIEQIAALAKLHTEVSANPD